MIKDRRGFSTRWLVQTAINITILIVALITFFMKMQSGINAANGNATKALNAVAVHADKTDVHMPLESAIETFVPRKEVENSLTAINDNLTGIKSEIIGLRQEIYRANGGAP